MNTDFHDVVVVGAGAAGLLAAAAAGDRGKKTLLLEKNARAGVKILMSDGTRCNVTHDPDQRGIVEAFGRPGRFLHSALARLSPSDVREILLAEDVPTKAEETGKVFPASDRAADVLRALLARVRRSGAELALNESLQDLKPTSDGWRLVTSRRELQCSKLVLTTGGRSYPASGTTGDGYRWAEQLGHTLIPLDLRAADCTREQRLGLVNGMRRLPIPISGILGYRKAEVTADGVSLDEVDSRTPESKRFANLFLAGEILDLDGPIGGYNFQAAFSTGWLAGLSV